MKFITSYQGLLPTHNLGRRFGVKLPTGHYGVTDASGNTVGNHPSRPSSCVDNSTMLMRNESVDRKAGFIAHVDRHSLQPIVTKWISGSAPV